jgi:hypothetical protein
MKAIVQRFESLDTKELDHVAREYEFLALLIRRKLKRVSRGTRGDAKIEHFTRLKHGSK